MRQRPAACLALLLFLVLQIIPAGIFYQPPQVEAKTRVQVTGEVSRQLFKNEKSQIYLKNCTVQSSAGMIQSKKLLLYLTEQTSYQIGTILSLSGTIYPIEEPTNPGQFDSRLYYAGQGVFYTVYADQARTLKVRPAPVRNGLSWFRKKIGQVYDEVLKPLQSGLLKAMVLGEKSDLDAEMKALYQRNGISHLLAISGLHVSLVGMGFYQLLRRVSGSAVLAGVQTMLFLTAYGWMTGGSVSALRAIMMCGIRIGAEMAGRTYDMLTAIGVTGLAFMMYRPLFVRQSGFLLSFGAVLAIALWMPIWNLYGASAAGKGRNRGLFERFLQQPFCISFSVVFFTFPVLLRSFFEYPLYSTILNLLVIPLMSILMTCGILCGIAGLWSLSLARILALPCQMILEFYEWSGYQMLHLPGAVLKIGSPMLWKVILYYSILAAILFLLYGQKRKKKYWRGKTQFQPSRSILTVSMAGMLFCVLVLCTRVSWGLRITMLDVGQGDCIFLRDSEGTSFLIDGGSSNVSNVGTYRILPFLKHEGVAKLDYILISHMDQDHIRGIQELIEDSQTDGGIRIGQVVLPRVSSKDTSYAQMEEKLQEADIPILYMGAGDSLKGEEFSLHCLWPGADMISEDTNALSMVLEADHKEFQMLFTGDIPEAVERKLKADGGLKPVEVLKVAHHGSRYSSSGDFLDQIRPSISLISCSASNRYGHPGQETLERLADRGSRIFMTKECGAVTIWTDGKRMKLRTFR